MGVTGWSATDYLNRAAGVYSTRPLMISAWCWSQAPGTGTAVEIGTDGSADNRRTLQKTGAIEIGVSEQDGSFEATAGSPDAHPDETWFQASGYFIASGDREATRDGGAAGSSVGIINPSAPDVTRIGVRSDESNPWDATGGLAEVSIWDATGLDATARRQLDALLAAGVNPLVINASGQFAGLLVAYWRLRSPTDVTDLSGNGHDLTEVGTLSIHASHPPVDGVVNTSVIASSGGDYTSLETWESDTEDDLAAAGVIEEARCDGFDDELVSALLISGATTDEHNYRRVYAAPGAEAGMPWRSTGAYTLRNTATNDGMNLQEAYLRVERIQVEIAAATTAFRACMESSDSVSMPGLRVDGCHVRSPSAAGRRIGFHFGRNAQVFVTNCVASDLGADVDTQGFGVGWRTADAGVLYNCTAVGVPMGFGETSGGRWDGAVAKNCVAYDCTVGFSSTSGLWNAGTEFNASDDSTHPGTDGVAILADPFEDEPNGDFHLASGSALIGAGTDLSADSDFPFSTDFDGDTRTAWSIGADDGPAAAGTAVGLATEVDVALGIAATKVRTVGLSAEVDVAQTTAALKALEAGLAAEADLAFGFGHARTRAIGIALESDEALGFVLNRTVAVGLAAEVDEAFDVARSKLRALGLSAEADEAFAVAHGAITPVGRATEGDLALGLQHARALALGLALEDDVSRAVQPLRAYEIGLTSEADLARSAAPVRGFAIGQPAEVDLALAIRATRSLTIGLGLEVDEAFAVVVVGGGGAIVLVGKYKAEHAAALAAIRAAEGADYGTEHAAALAAIRDAEE